MGKNNLDSSELIIKGQNHYRGNIISLFEKKTNGFSHELDIDGILEPEPTNAHDPDAVILRVHGFTVGYIAQEFATSVKKQIGSGVKVQCKLMWNRDPEHPMFSVVIISIE